MNDYNDILEIIDEIPDIFSDDIAEEAWEWATASDDDDLPLS